MRNRYHYWKIFSFLPKTYCGKIRLALFCISFIPLSLLFFSILLLTRETLFQNAENNLYDSLILSSTAIETNIDQIQSISGVVSDILSQELSKPTNVYSEYYYYSSFTDLRNLISNAQNNYNVEGIRIYSDSIRAANLDNLNFFPLESCFDPVNGCFSGNEFVTSNSLTVVKRMNPNGSVTGAYNVLRFSGNIYKLTEKKPVCVYSIDLDQAIIEKCITPLSASAGSAVYLLNDSNEILLTSGCAESTYQLPADPVEFFYDGDFSVHRHFKDGLLTLSTELPTSNWTLVLTTPYQEVVSSTKYITYLFFMIASAVLLVNLVLDFMFSKILTQRISHLSSVMRRFNLLDGDLPVELLRPENTSHMDDIDLLSDSFYQLIIYNRKLFRETLESSVEVEKYKFNLLQSQINPHFLYNALDTIYICQKRGNIHQAEHAVTSLAQFYRIALSKGMDIITLEQELEMVSHYMEIEGLGYQSQIQFFVTNEGIDGDILLPKFSLQPLVENSIKHGITTSRMTLKIEIHIYCNENGSVIFEVTDNGKGIETAQLEKIQDLLSSTSSHTEGHFGLYNVDRRMKIYFGDDCGLQLESRPEGGMRVWFSISSEQVKKKNRRNFHDKPYYY